MAGHSYGTGLPPMQLKSNWYDGLGITMRRESRSRGRDKLANWKAYRPSMRDSRFRMIGFSEGE